MEVVKAYDKVTIVMDCIMEHWLEGNCNPPKELIDQHFETKDEALQALYNDFENIKANQVFAERTCGMNRAFYKKIDKQFGVTEITPELFPED
jgi:hypothetical protein